MASPFRRGREARKRAAEIDALLTSRQALVHERQPHVNSLTTWLEDRKRRNGFGDDFDITFRGAGEGAGG